MEELIIKVDPTDYNECSVDNSDDGTGHFHNPNNSPSLAKQSHSISKKSQKKKPPICHPCTMCESVLYSRSGFLRHIKRHAIKKKLDHPNNPEDFKLEKFQCDQCFATLKNYKSLRRHVQIHLREKHKINVEQGTTVNDEMMGPDESTKATIFGNNKLQVCQFCGAKVVSLAQHMQEHSDARKFECDICHGQFKSKHNIKDHMEIHINKRAFCCDQCPKRFNVQSHLAKHLRSHSEWRPHQCEQCGRRFKNLTSLKVHIRSHTLDRPYKCTLCPNTYSTGISLKLHTRIHYGLKPYVCDICNRGFSDLSAMKVHKLQHTGENPYICHMCGKTTKQASNLKSHYRHFHKIQNISGDTIRINSKILSKFTAEELRKCDISDLLNRELLKQKEDQSKLAIEASTEKEVNNCVPVGKNIIKNELQNLVQNGEPPPLSHKDSPNVGKLHDLENKLTVTENKLTVDKRIKLETRSNNAHHSATPPKEIEQILIKADPLEDDEYNIIDVKLDLANQCYAEDKIEFPIECFVKSELKEGFIEGGGGVDNTIVHAENNFCEPFIELHQKDEKTAITHKRGVKYTKCNICQKRFVNFEKHVQTCHAQSNDKNESPTQCTVCHKRYTNYEQHMARHDSTIFPFECTICDKKFRKRESLRDHLLAHKNEKNFICDVCGGKFLLASNLRKHFKAHSDIRPYRCDECGNQFKSKSSLRVHMRLHTGKKEYVCKQCGKEYSSPMGLKVHLRVHAGIRPYKCDLCNSAFYDRATYTQHYRTHSGERPYKCEICGKGHTQASNLKSHLRHYHKTIVKTVRINRDKH